jgi:mono/diheme cytochrome c family protein
VPRCKAGRGCYNLGMRPARVAVTFAAAALAGCGGGGEQAKVATTPTAAQGIREAQIAKGRTAFEAAGCLACHQVGTRGASGPGSNLTGIGARMSHAEIRRALMQSPAPMPSFRQLGEARLDDLVAYLASLRASSPGGPPCPDGSDCG